MTCLEPARVAVATTTTTETVAATVVLMDLNSKITIRSSRAEEEEEEEGLVAKAQTKEMLTMQGGSCREAAGATRACELA